MRVRSVLVSIAMVASVVIATATPAGAQEPMCDGEVATIVGTPGDDVRPGTPGRDVIVALGGNDRILAGDGDDVVCAGPGNDFVKGQRGNDILLGGGGNDRMFGNAGADTLLGGNGHDVLWGGVGPDDIWAGLGNDTVNAGHGNDFALGGLGNDKINGSTGADELWGGQGADVITGGKGFDDLDGGAANDLITGGPGEDFINGGLGTDRCRVDIFDGFINCQRGNVLGASGSGDGEVEIGLLSPEFVLPSPGGPSYVLHINAAPAQGQLLTVTVKDANGGLLFEGFGFDRVFSNVLVAGGVPALVEVSGADFWVAAFVKTSILHDDLILNPDQGSQVFGVAPSLDGFPQAITITATNNGNNSSVFQVVSVGDDGITLELSDTLAAGESAVFTGDLRASAHWVGILTAPLVTWEFSLDNG